MTEPKSKTTWSPAYTPGRECDVPDGPCNCGAWHDALKQAVQSVSGIYEYDRLAPTGESQEEFTREQLFALHLELTSKALQLMRKKNADYSTTGPFMNFLACESYGITAEDGIITRMSDKISRLASVMRKGAEVSESEDDTIIDVINYAVCLAGLRRSREKK